LLFVGNHELSIDDKGRMAFPSPWRARLDPARDGKGLYSVVLNGPVLALYTERGFEQLAEALDRSERPTSEVVAYERAFFSLAEYLEIDKQGRVQLPRRLLNRIALSGDVVAYGMKDHAEILPLEQANAFIDRALSNQGLLVTPREIMRAASQPTRPAAD
jgi:MraZ protein